jgi:hypothetical protein
MLGACATRIATPSAVVVSADAPPITLSARGALAARDLERVRRLLPAAQAQLRGWGLLWRRPVVVEIHSEPSTFIRASGQTVPTLRAWSTWQRIDLLTTDTWERATGAAAIARRRFT